MKRLHVLALALTVAVAGLALFTFSAVARDERERNVRASLNGFNEVVGPGSISTAGTGSFRATVDESGQMITYTLTYTLDDEVSPTGQLGAGAVPTATQAHIHFAERHVGGGIIAFLCNVSGTVPPAAHTPPACPLHGGTVTGTITPQDIIGPTGQGIEPGHFAEAVRAIRAGAVYANVHSTRWPAGEIRGQLGNRQDNDRGEEEDD